MKEVVVLRHVGGWSEGRCGGKEVVVVQRGGDGVAELVRWRWSR